MHLLKHKPVKPRPFIETVSEWAVPGHRRTSNRRYNAKGEFVGMSKPAPVVSPSEQKRVREAHAEGAKKGRPAPEQVFDMRRYRPLPGRLLLSRGPWIKEENGIALPEDQWRHEPYFVVVAVGAGVTCCEMGDKILCARGWRPKEVWINQKFYMAREQAVVGIMESI